MFSGPFLLNLLRTGKSKKESAAADDMYALADFHVGFEKMKTTSRRAFPLDFSYEAIAAYLALENHFEGMEHYQDRQGLNPGVVCCKVVNIIVYNNRLNFSKTGGDVEDFWDVPKIIAQKSETMKLVYRAFRIQKKDLPLPSAESELQKALPPPGQPAQFKGNNNNRTQQRGGNSDQRAGTSGNANSKPANKQGIFQSIILENFNNFYNILY